VEIVNYIKGIIKDKKDNHNAAINQMILTITNPILTQLNQTTNKLNSITKKGDRIND
jgi:hypothetical protein